MALVAALGAGVGADLGHELGGHLQPVGLLVGGGDGAQDVCKAVGLWLRQGLACGASSASDADTSAENQMHHFAWQRHRAATRPLLKARGSSARHQNEMLMQLEDLDDNAERIIVYAKYVYVYGAISLG